MEHPFILISGTVAHREEFIMNIGHKPTWALFYIKEGSFELDFGSGMQTILPGDTVIFNDTASFLRRVVSPLVFVCIKFCVNPRCPFTLNLPVGRIALRDAERFRSTVAIYESIIDAEDRRLVYYREHLLEDMLFQIFSENEHIDAAENPTDSDDPMIHAATDYIKRALTSKIRVEDVCRALGTNPSTLNWRFRRELNLSVGAYITGVRLHLAKNLLRGTTYSIGEIAARCGYDNVYYFSNAFRSGIGMPPTAYRKLYR